MEKEGPADRPSMEVDKESSMLSPREDDDGCLSPNTRKLIENLAEGSVISDGSEGVNNVTDASLSVGHAAETGAMFGAPANPGDGPGPGPMHMLYPGGQMLPVGHALQYLGAAQQQQQLQTQAAQQLFLLYLQNQHASFMHHAVLGASAAQGMPMNPLQHNVTMSTEGGNAASEDSAPTPAMLEQQQKLQEHQKVLQAHIQQQVIPISVARACMLLHRV
jgi:hypothetical protein